MIIVCHIVNLITGRADGVYTHLKMIFKNSDKTKFQHILIFQGGEKVERELTQLGAKVYVSESLKKKISLKSFLDIYKILKENEVEIIHTHLIKPYAIAGLVNIFLKKKFIFNYHGIFLDNNPYYNFIERSIYWLIHHIIYLLGKVDLVLVPSKRSKELLMNETKIFPEPTVYYNGYCLKNKNISVNEESLRKIQETKKNKIIIAVIGRLEIDKRIDRAIHLFKNIKNQNKKIHLLVFGDGSLKDNLENLVKKYDIEESVKFLGYVESIQEYFNYFDILLFTSDWEGMPLSMWEAMANGVPVVAPDIGGFKEIIEENNCGFVYEPNDSKDAELKLTKLIQDDQLRKSLGGKGRIAIEKEYDEKNFIKQIETAYLDSLNK